MATFFVSCPLGYENSLAQEIKNFWFEMIDLDGLPTRSLPPEFEILQGGLELNTADHLGFQINLFSKLANRVLLRITKFEARYFDQFEKSLSKVEFEKFLDLEFLKGQVQFKVESHKSRLNNEKNLLEAAANALKKKNIKIDDKALQTVYARIEKDRVTLSLDTSGEHLHRRGYSSFRGEAPLRETLAAYMVMKLKQNVLIDENLILLDPFAGSGTLLFEAASSHLPNLERDYSWLHFKSAPKLFKSDSWKKNYRWFADSVKTRLWAVDKDEKSAVNIAQNEIDFKSIFHLNEINLKTETKDSREISFETIPGKFVWAICNPPYGIRLADEHAREVIEDLESGLDGVIVIHPEKWKFKFKKMKLKEIEDFSNQGLNLKLSIYRKVL